MKTQQYQLKGDVAEGLGSGLQIRLRRFKSGHHLHLRYGKNSNC